MFNIDNPVKISKWRGGGEGEKLVEDGQLFWVFKNFNILFKILIAIGLVLSC